LRWRLTGRPGDVDLRELAGISRIAVPNSISSALFGSPGYGDEYVHVIFTDPDGAMLAEITSGMLRSHRYADVSYPMSVLEPLRELGLSVTEERIGTFGEFHRRHPDGVTNKARLALRRLYFRLI
jgi:hypothetical protein